MILPKRLPTPDCGLPSVYASDFDRKMRCPPVEGRDPLIACAQRVKLGCQVLKVGFRVERLGYAGGICIDAVKDGDDVRLISWRFSASVPSITADNH